MKSSKQKKLIPSTWTANEFSNLYTTGDISKPFLNSNLGKLGLINTASKELMEELLDKESLTKNKNNLKYFKVTRKNNSTGFFKIPIYFSKEVTNYTHNVFVLDGRMIAGNEEYEISINFSKLMLDWEVLSIANKQYPLSSLIYPIRVYVNWIKVLIANQFGIEGRNALYLDIVSMYYFIWMHLDNEYIYKNNDKIILLMKNVTQGLSNDLIMEVLDKLDSSPIESNNRSISVLCNWIKDVIGGEYIKNLSVSILLSAASTSLFHSNFNKYISQLALEYPPMFYSILKNLITDRSLNRTRLGNLAKVSDKEIIRTFETNINRILEST